MILFEISCAEDGESENMKLENIILLLISLWQYGLEADWKSPKFDQTQSPINMILFEL